jgi:FKBP-type peptidyl-prolyl cis-trans isomerase SlyD
MIASGKVVSIHYTLKDDAGNVVDSSSGGEPLTYLHGGGNIIPGLESGLEGATVGSSKQVVVPPGAGYGEKSGPPPQTVPRGAFPAGVDIEAGMQFGVEGPGGQPIPVWVLSVDDNEVTLSFDHPLAGQSLHFDVTVMEVRDASPEELQHGHPHGPGGHHHH